MKVANPAWLKPRWKLLGGIFLGMVLLLTAICLAASASGHLSINLPTEHKPVFSGSTSGYPARLHVEKNSLVDSSGRKVMLRGLMPPDPARLSEKGKFNRDFFQQMHDTGANVIRIPVHPERYELDPDYLWRYLDASVAWCGEMGLYAIIDLHFIGNVETGAGSQMPELKIPSKQFTLDFWRQAAAYFKDVPNVIFEIVNEPQSITPAAWRRSAGEIVLAIRSAGAQQLVIVGGVEFSKDLSWVLDGPVTGENIAYAAHIYPAHAAASWDTWFGTVSAQAPVISTEWGWMDSSADSGTAYLVGSAANYGEPYLNYLEAHGIGWVACWYDDDWLPAMFEKGSSKLTAYGQFVHARLGELK